jgi:hypothetical protein
MKRKVFYNIEPSKIEFELDETSKNKQFPNRSGLRIKLYYKDENEKKDLIIAPEGSKFYSFGVQEDAYSDPQDSKNYNMCLCINIDPKNKDSEKNEKFCSHISSIYESCKDYIFENREKLGIKINEKESLKNIFKNPLFEVSKDNNSKYSGFRLYPKLIVDKKNNKVWTTFFEQTCDSTKEEKNTKICELNSLINEHIYVYPAIFLDSLYIIKPYSAQAQVSLQYKLSEAIIQRIAKNIEPSLKIFDNSSDEEKIKNLDEKLKNLENI